MALRVKHSYKLEEHASPSISYELHNKNTIAWRRKNIVLQVRKVCNMEIQMVTFVMKKCEVDRQVIECI